MQVITDGQVWKTIPTTVPPAKRARPTLTSQVTIYGWSISRRSDRVGDDGLFV